MSAAVAPATWARGRLDEGRGPRQILFGRMYEDAAIEARVLPRGRVLCIASAGCTAISLAADREVVAVDVNPAQLAYAADRVHGGDARVGAVERLMSLARAAAPLVGWTRARVGAFLDLDDPIEQLAYWSEHLDTRRFRVALDAALSIRALSAVYASPLLACLPPHLGAVMRARLARGFARHGNRSNPYARALLLGERADATPAREVALVHAYAADYLERVPRASFDGFTLSNILDGASDEYRARLMRAIARTARPGAMVVLRSFGEPRDAAAAAWAAEDRSMIWGSVEVRRI